MGDGDRIFAQFLSWIYFLFLAGLLGWFIYSVNSIRKSQRNIATTLEKILVYFQEKDSEETKK